METNFTEKKNDDIIKLQRAISEKKQQISDLNSMLIDNEFKTDIIDSQKDFLHKLEIMLDIRKKDKW